MIGWLFGQRRMVGGLYFGVPGWMPERIEGDVEEGSGAGGEEILAREGMMNLVERVGVGRTSGIGPGVLEQLRELGDKKVRALVLNLVPTQPEFAIGAGLSRMKEELSCMVEGLLALQKVLGAERVMVVVDRHDFKTKRVWRKAVRKKKVEVRGILNRYPQGHPVVLMRSLFGKRMAVGKLPVGANRVIVDGACVWGIGRWLLRGKGMAKRPVQLFAAESAIEKGTAGARLVMGEVGETVEAMCLRYGVKVENMQVIVNGVMAGEEVEAGRARIESWTESVAVRERAETEKPSACFSCGWCLDVCPTGLNPVGLLDLAERAQLGAVSAVLRSGEAKESRHCIGCGLCSYVCPTRLPLTQGTLRLKGWVEGLNEDGGGK